MIEKRLLKKFYHDRSMSETVIQTKDWLKNPFPVLKKGQATSKQKVGDLRKQKNQFTGKLQYLLVPAIPSGPCIMDSK